MKLFNFYRAIGGPGIKVTSWSKEGRQKSIPVSHTGNIQVGVPKVIIIRPASDQLAFSTWILFLWIAVQNGLHSVLISNFTGHTSSLFSWSICFNLGPLQFKHQDQKAVTWVGIYTRTILIMVPRIYKKGISVFLVIWKDLLYSSSSHWEKKNRHPQKILH